MPVNTSIEWCDRTWNPIVGCSKVSEGCQHCYAASFAKRFGPKQGWRFDEIRFLPGRLDQPLRWKRPQRIFVCSMGDIFHEKVAPAWREQVWRVIERCQQHTFIMLTKRPEQMARSLFSSHRLDNLWVGVSVENQGAANERIPWLLQCNAVKRIVSAEPLLEQVHLGDAEFGGTDAPPGRYKSGAIHWHTPTCEGGCEYSCGGGKLQQGGIDWLIIGAETGQWKRPCEPRWVANMVQRARMSNVPVFVKQQKLRDLLPQDMPLMEFPVTPNLI